jgi:DNA polymerase elongation subunit (family B)
MSKKELIIKEIQEFLEGKNDLKYLVNIEVHRNTNQAYCVFQKPDGDAWTEYVKYTPFIYIKNLKEEGYQLYGGDKKRQKLMIDYHGITITKMKTGKQPRLAKGYPYKVTSTKSLNSIIEFFKEGGIDMYEKLYGPDGKPVKDKNDRYQYKFRHLFYSPRLEEQFFISTGIRLFKGIEEYDQVHRVTFDIETTGLRHEIARVFAIGVRDNRGFERVLEVEKEDDDDAERDLITLFFDTVDYIKPAVIVGYHSEMFDFDFIFGRAEKLGMELSNLITSRDHNHNYKKGLLRRNATLKIGNTTEDYKATYLWGYTILDILHAVKRTVAVNTDIKNNKLKYIASFEGIAKEDRMYIDGEDGGIGKMWIDNKTHLINKVNNTYVEIPAKFQELANQLFWLQESKLNGNVDEKTFNMQKKVILDTNKEFPVWLRENIGKLNSDEKKPDIKFVEGKDILRRYLLDDLWETEKVDNLYNQSSFLLAKIVPTTFGRVATMGNAAIWNLLMIAWSYENDLAIPEPDVTERFSGGLARCYKKGWTKRLIKIDFASLYPMEQLTWDIFPMFDITNVIKKMLTYMTTTRNIYKKLASSTPLQDEEVSLLKSIDHETYEKYVNDSFTTAERKLYKTKQLPIKILNNSLFGALGSGFAFNWSDNSCAARITCSGRLDLRYAISWFSDFGLVPLLAVTDGVNFGIPDYTNIMVDGDKVWKVRGMVKIEEAWKYNGEVGVAALIEKFNNEEMTSPFMSVDNDGEFKACLNLSRINYALLTDKDKIKLTGNTIKSKTMPEYIEEFIDKGLKLILEGKGDEFVDYYHSYAEDIYYKQIPLKKIASKSKYKHTLRAYVNRGTDKNGKEKASQAHMELILAEREKIAREIFEERFDELLNSGKITKTDIEKYTIGEILSIVDVWMPPEPELDSMIYYVNTGTRKSHGDVKTDPKTKEKVLNCKLINAKDLEENPDMTGEYNVEKYLDAFNTRVETILDGFDKEIREKILVKIEDEEKVDASGKKKKERVLKKNIFTKEQLQLKNYDHDDYDESMYLEKKEVIFWNRYGLDPKRVWDGFKISEESPLQLEIYEHALNYVSDQMVKAGKSPVKSRNDNYGKGDYVLIKSGRINRSYTEILEHTYDLAYHNGEHLEVLRENIHVPKSPIELEIEKKKAEEEAKKAKLREQDAALVDGEIERTVETKKIIQNLFSKFKEKMGIPDSVTMDFLFSQAPNAKIAFDDFCAEFQEQHDGLDEYGLIDEGDS